MWTSKLPEVAVIGYSNCGKSSTINALCGAKRADDDHRTSFAAVSARVSFVDLDWLRPMSRIFADDDCCDLQAGWTTGIKWIELESKTRGVFSLVDMPGYGDAVATKQQRDSWVSENSHVVMENIDSFCFALFKGERRNTIFQEQPQTTTVRCIAGCLPWRCQAGQSYSSSPKPF